MTPGVFINPGCCIILCPPGQAELDRVVRKTVRSGGNVTRGTVRGGRDQPLPRRQEPCAGVDLVKGQTSSQEQHRFALSPYTGRLPTEQWRRAAGAEGRMGGKNREPQDQCSLKCNLPAVSTPIPLIRALFTL